MMLIVGILLVPIIFLIIMQLEKFNVKDKTKFLYRICLIVITILYFIIAFTIKTEPYNYEILSLEDIFIYSAVIFLFTPFLWLVLFYCCGIIYKTLKIQKNKKIKSNEQYIYYRDDLNKISPSIIQYTTMMDINLKKCISSTILKLMINGYIKEKNNVLCVTQKNNENLIQSEKIILQAISSKEFDEKLYKNVVKAETINCKYIRKNSNGKIIKILKMFITIIIPIIITIGSIELDKFVFENYYIYIEDDGIEYIKLENEEEIENLYYKEIKDKNDYYHYEVEKNGKVETFYKIDYIRADKLEYSIVRFAQFLNIVIPFLILISIISWISGFFILLEQIVYFNKDYIRTLKGNELLSKAYALKNYLKDYSLIKNKSKNDLILWEYYLVYAVALDVNKNIENEIIEKYSNNLLAKY